MAPASFCWARATSAGLAHLPCDRSILADSLSAWTTYLEVCRLGSLSAAAVELGYTQSAVSRQIAGLERAAGVRLLERLPRGVVPTPAGEAFRHHARVVVNEAARAVQSARDVGDHPALPLVVGATPAIAASIVPVACASGGVVGRFPWTLCPRSTATSVDGPRRRGRPRHHHR